MKTRVVVLASALLLGALAGAGGCAADRAAVQLQAICSPPTSCAFTGKCDAQYIWFYAYDRAVGSTRPAAMQNLLTLFVQAENQLKPNGDGVTRTDTNGAHIDEIVVELEGAVTGTQTFGSTEFIAAGATGVVTVPIAITGTANGEAVASIKLRGFYDNGSRFETGDIPITFTVCASGCAPTMCAGGPTCPPDSEGQMPLNCRQ